MFSRVRSCPYRRRARSRGGRRFRRHVADGLVRRRLSGSTSEEATSRSRGPPAPVNGGKGAALRAGSRSSFRPQDSRPGVDADGQHEPEDLPASPCSPERDDFVIGSRWGESGPLPTLLPDERDRQPHPDPHEGPRRRGGIGYRVTLHPPAAALALARISIETRS